MSDLKKAAEELGATAALSQAKRAAGRALEDAFSTDEEREAREAREAEEQKKKRRKLLLYGVVGLFLVLGAVGLVLNYWQYFLLAGVVGLLGLYGRHRWRKRRAPKQSPAASKKAPERLAPKARVQPAINALEPDRSVDDELAELKSRLQK